MARVARNLTDPFNGFLLGKRYLILDRDGKFTAGFKDRLRTEGIRPVLIARQAPDMNAIAERWVLSARRECLDRMIFFGMDHRKRPVDPIWKAAGGSPAFRG